VCPRDDIHTVDLHCAQPTQQSQRRGRSSPVQPLGVYGNAAGLVEGEIP
jgi:hypothetical protein